MLVESSGKRQAFCDILNVRFCTPRRLSSVLLENFMCDYWELVGGVGTEGVSADLGVYWYCAPTMFPRNLFLMSSYGK